MFRHSKFCKKFRKYLILLNWHRAGQKRPKLFIDKLPITLFPSSLIYIYILLSTIKRRVLLCHPYQFNNIKYLYTILLYQLLCLCYASNPICYTSNFIDLIDLFFCYGSIPVNFHPNLLGKLLSTRRFIWKLVTSISILVCICSPNILKFTIFC